MLMIRSNIAWLVIAFVVSACATGTKLAPHVKTVDPDQTPILKPRSHKEYRYWDFIDHTLVYQIGKTLDLSYTGRRFGGSVGIGEGRQADNVNAIDEVCESSWYANRHYLHPMTVEQLARGPGAAVPDTTKPWEIVSGKFWGVSAGFNIRDSKNQIYIIKFDTKDWPEMASSAEVISTKILYAAGYNVPRNSVVIFSPSKVFIGPEATVKTPDGTQRPMTATDLENIWAKVNIRPDGSVRAVSSMFLPGEILGPFAYHGRRSDDPNDRVAHEHRRELRGLRVISSWLNDADRRTANTLDMYVPVSGDRGFVKHYIIDMGSTLGSNSRIPHLPRYGNEYLWDPGNILKAMLSLGFHTKRFDNPQSMKHPTIGYFENNTFRPGKWVTAYPNPAFQWCTGRDGFWGAKIVTSFSNEDVAAIVRTGRLSSSEAETELTRLLIERRDMIGRYWFGKVSPLDRFHVEDKTLYFEDLAITQRLANPARTSYRYRYLDGRGRSRNAFTETDEMSVPIQDPGTESFQGTEIQTRREIGWGKSIRVFIHTSTSGNSTVIRIEREE